MKDSPPTPSTSLPPELAAKRQELERRMQAWLTAHHALLHQRELLLQEAEQYNMAVHALLPPRRRSWVPSILKAKFWPLWLFLFSAMWVGEQLGRLLL